jgi:hypothetical protein
MLNAPELISDDIAVPINSLADVAERPVSANPEDRPSQIVERELLRSLGNVLSGILSPFLNYARDAKSAARKENLRGVEEFKKGTTAAVLFGNTAFVASLAASMPAEFGCIILGLMFLKTKLKLSPKPVPSWHRPFLW